MLTLHIGETLTVHIYGSADSDQYVLIDRDGAGLVRIEVGELQRLADLLTLAAGDLVGPVDPLAEDPEPEPPEWINEGGLWSWQG